MSISNALMWHYYDLLSLKTPDEIKQIKTAVANGKNPRDAKIELAMEIVARFYDEAKAHFAKNDFETKFKRGEFPEDTEIHELKFQPEKEYKIAYVLKFFNLVNSTSDAIRLLDQGGVKINGNAVTTNFTFELGKLYQLQIGKRKFARIQVS
jgi:tyrosyl-tRNA synthetase